MRRYRLPLAAAIVLLVNAVVLIRVVRNRTGQPDAVVTLTERELPRAWSSASDESSGVALRFDHARSFYLVQDLEEAGDDALLDEPRLASLGFDVRLPADPEQAQRTVDRELSRRAFAVLEADGARWAAWRRRVEARVASLDEEVANGQQTVEEATRLREWAATELESGSRLFIVDVGPEAEALRGRYPDRRAHLVLPAQVSPRLVGFDSKKPCRPPACRLGGSVTLLTRDLNVPKPLQGVLLGQVARAAPAPRYQVELTVGRDHEPWITAIRPLAASK